MEYKCTEYSWGRVWKNSKGEFHRENDLPAVKYNNGFTSWCINGVCHRELGPARIYANGTESWYLNGIEYTPENMPNKLFLEYLKWKYKKKLK